MTRSPATDPKPGDVLFVAGAKLAVTWCDEACQEEGYVGYRRRNTHHTVSLTHWRELCAGAMVLENADLKGKE